MPAPLPEAYFQGAGTVGVFSPRADWDEPASFPLPKSCRTAYPRIEDERMEFRLARAEELVPNARLKILEPAATAPAVEPDLLFVPALLADRQGARIGRGGGFYDRYLSARPRLRTLAVLRSDYVLQQLPASWLHEGDRPVGAVLTESQFFQFQPRRNPT